MTPCSKEKTLGGHGELVLYVDYDGCLHHEDVWWHPRRGPYIKATGEFSLFQHVPLLAEALRPYPAVRIVLSTSWVRHYSYSKAKNRLPPELQERVVGATFHSAMNEEFFAAQPRGVQVWSDVLRRRPKDWLALDDDGRRWPVWCRHKLVRSDDVLGISKPSVSSDLAAKLAHMCKENSL